MPFHACRAVPIVLALMVAPFASPQAKYTIVDLGSLNRPPTMAFAINKRAQVVGSSTTASGDTHAFLWSHGVMTDLGTLGGHFSEARGINNLGQVVGSAHLPSGFTHAFIWENGKMTDLGDFGGQFSTATGINDVGQAVGSAAYAGGDILPFRWENGVMTDLGDLGAKETFAWGINIRGQVVGESPTALPTTEFHAVLWEYGRIVDLTTRGGPIGGFSAAYGINDRSQVVGTFLVSGFDPQHGFMWDSGVTVDLGRGTAVGINNRSQVVLYGGLWENGTATSLEALGCHGCVAFAINDHGQVAGYFTAADGAYHGFLLKKTADVDGDGVISCADLAPIRAGIGTRRGENGYVAAADVNGDGIIDIRDLAFVARQIPAATRCP